MGLYRIIDHRASRVLRATAECFADFLRFSECGHGLEALPGHGLYAQRLRLEQSIIRRLFGRLYCLHWHWRLELDLGERSLHVRLRHRGWSRGTHRVHFEAISGTAALAGALNTEPALLALCKTLELGRLAIRYDAAARRCEVELRPSYGDYIWVLLPPLNYVRQPTAREVRASVALIQRLCAVLRRAAENPPSPR